MNRILTITSTIALALLFTTSGHADDNHEIIEKVMKEGLKGDDSPMAKVLDKKASADETKELLVLVKTLDGTKAPVGEQDGYNKRIGALIETLTKVAEGDTSNHALDALDEAQSCKACHSEHKPKKKE